MDIVAGNCQTLQVTFNPNAPGTVNGTLSIASNDPAFPTTTVSLTGSAGALEISVTGNGAFGNVRRACRLPSIPENRSATGH